jgi:hypothetical protein
MWLDPLEVVFVKRVDSLRAIDDQLQRSLKEKAFIFGTQLKVESTIRHTRRNGPLSGETR